MDQWVQKCIEDLEKLSDQRLWGRAQLRTKKGEIKASFILSLALVTSGSCPVSNLKKNSSFVFLPLFVSAEFTHRWWPSRKTAGVTGQKERKLGVDVTSAPTQ